MEHFALLDDNISGFSKFFYKPKRVISTHNPSDIPEVFNKVDAATKSGCFVVGALSYEVASHFSKKIDISNNTFQVNEKVSVPISSGWKFEDKISPLVCFGVFEKQLILNEEETDNFLLLNTLSLVHLAKNFFPKSSPAVHFSKKHLAKPFFLKSKLQYKKMFEFVQKEITLGNTYQVNLTVKKIYPLPAHGNLLHLYRVLREKQRVHYGALLYLPNLVALSRSPELFFSVEENKEDGKSKNRKLTVKPMKGTVPVGRTKKINYMMQQHLLQSKKNRAENLMIVDLLRNDISRVAKVGSVKVDELYKLESYSTVNQLTSTISCLIKSNVKMMDIFKALYPCGSITGAPKQATQSLISKTERNPRGVYTGAIGYFSPQNQQTSRKGSLATFNVAIRTLQLIKCLPEKKGALDVLALLYGVGGGITKDSELEEEYKEIKWKTLFLNHAFKKWLQLFPFSNHKSLGYTTTTSRNPYIFETMLAVSKRRNGSKCFDSRKTGTEGSKGSRSTAKYSFPLKKFHVQRLIRSSQLLACSPQIVGGRSFARVTADEVESIFESVEKEIACYCGKTFKSDLRVKIKLFANGKFETEIVELAAKEEIPNFSLPSKEQILSLSQRTLKFVKIAKNRMDSLRLPSGYVRLVKSSLRKGYETAMKEAKKEKILDYLFFNEKKELTEGSIHNVFLQLQKEWFTPPLFSGVLPGVVREKIIAEQNVTVRPITLREVQQADVIALSNAVKGVTLVKIL